MQLLALKKIYFIHEQFFNVERKKSSQADEINLLNNEKKYRLR